MSNRITDIAKQFVDLVLKYEDWKKVEKFPTNEVKILFNTVSFAGFDPKKIVLGTLLGEEFPINNSCPFKVVNQEGEDCFFATGWLDELFRSVSEENKSDQLIREVTKEIRRSIPLAPIQLTIAVDLLLEYPCFPNDYDRYFVDHTRNGDQLSDCVGLHKHCDGFMDRISATKTHDAIVCRECHLHVLFPKKVKTYGGLRKVLVVA